MLNTYQLLSKGEDSCFIYCHLSKSNTKHICLNFNLVVFREKKMINTSAFTWKYHGFNTIIFIFIYLFYGFLLSLNINYGKATFLIKARTSCYEKMNMSFKIFKEV